MSSSSCLLVGGWFVMCLSLAIGIGNENRVDGQTLDEAIRAQLSNDCGGLTGGGPATGLSPIINLICLPRPNDPGAPPASPGEATASSPSPAFSIENRRKDRLGEREEHVVASPVNEIPFPKNKNVGLFSSINVESLDRNRTPFGAGFNSTVIGATLGADYLASNDLLVGGAFTFKKHDGDYDSGGNFSQESYGGLIYASFLPLPNAFVDLTVGYTHHNNSYEQPRSFRENNSEPLISGIAESDSNGSEISVRVLAGYDHPLGPLSLGPRIGLNFSYLTIASYKESGAGGLALEYDSQQVTSVQGTMGGQATLATSTSYGVWVTQVNADFIHEFENYQRFITVRFIGDQRVNSTTFRFQNDKPVRNFVNLSFGTILLFPNNIQPFVNFRTILGNEQFDNFGGTIGIRIQLE